MTNGNNVTMKDATDPKIKIALALSAAALLAGLYLDSRKGPEKKNQPRKASPLFWAGMAGLVGTFGWLLWRMRKLQAANSAAVPAAVPAQLPTASQQAVPQPGHAPSMPEPEPRQASRPTRNEGAAARSFHSRLLRHVEAKRRAEQAAAAQHSEAPSPVDAMSEEPALLDLRAPADAGPVADPGPITEVTEDASADPPALDHEQAAPDAEPIIVEVQGDADPDEPYDGDSLDDGAGIPTDRMLAILAHLTDEEKQKLDMVFMALPDETTDRIRARLKRLRDDVAADFLRELLQRHTETDAPAPIGGG